MADFRIPRNELDNRFNLRVDKTFGPGFEGKQILNLKTKNHKNGHKFKQTFLRILKPHKNPKDDERGTNILVSTSSGQQKLYISNRKSCQQILIMIK